MPAGGRHEFEVLVWNRGTSDLKIHWVNLPAGFEVRRLPRAPIAAGEGAVIRLRMDVPPSGESVQRELEVNHSGLGGRSRRRFAVLI